MKDTLQILTSRINQLELKLDSLNQNAEMQRLSYELNSKQDIISQVNEFYDSAWLKLIIVISILGVLVPIVAQYFQRKNLNDLTEFIRNQMNDSFDRRIEELEEYNKSKIESELLEFKDKISDIEKQNKKTLIELDAITYYLQGRASVLSKQYFLAIPSFFKSAYLFLDSDRPERVKVQFVNLKLCLKGINSTKPILQANKIMKDGSYKMTIDETIDYFKSHKKKELYEGYLEPVIKEIERIKAANIKATTPS